ncbi:MAG: TerB family tellurite resistance protein, partial [Gammaproteobacteria bacterium]|nr:TerB family tellurite resistance protein [Gammaproteobacteria bacterium]
MEAALRARLRRWFTAPGEALAGDEDINLSLAALLVEIMRADYADDLREYEVVKRLLARRFDLDEEAAEQLLEEGERAADRAVSLFKHTRALDVGLQEEEKFDVIEALWQTAFADGKVEGQEDYLVHKVGDLLHVR